MKNSKTLTNLRNTLNGKIYIYLKNEEISRKFLLDAESEGFCFGQIKPSQSSLPDIVALEKDKQLSHVGIIGHIAFGCKSYNNNIHRVDYQRYINGDNDYFI